MVQIIRAHLTFPSTGTTKNISLAHHSIQVVRQIILRATHALDPHWSIAVRESAWRPSPPKSATSRQRGRREPPRAVEVGLHRVRNPNIDFLHAARKVRRGDADNG